MMREGSSRNMSRYPMVLKDYGFPSYFARGINSFQLFNDGSRWWITVYWEGEDPTHPLPEKYLK